MRKEDQERERKHETQVDIENGTFMMNKIEHAIAIDFLFIFQRKIFPVSWTGSDSGISYNWLVLTIGIGAINCVYAFVCVRREKKGGGVGRDGDEVDEEGHHAPVLAAETARATR